jgi:hypothetical protein
MNPGLPGLGISGLYYILVALVMPACALFRWATRRGAAHARWRVALRQCAIAAGSAAAIAAAFWLLDTVFELAPVGRNGGSGAGAVLHDMRISAMLISLCVLAFVLGLTQLARLAFRPGRGKRGPAGPPHARLPHAR